MFKNVDSKMNLPKLEEEVLKFWNENRIFEKSIEQRDPSNRYTFYDGPPFATGTPHYGHIVASLIKDAVPRYWTMRGKYIERKWGWDCHGLPIENIAEKELGITEKKQIEEMGVDKFEDVCRSKVMSYVSEWERIIPRLGRWADMKNSYRTMDLNYMESVWWVFKELWNKGLIYEGYRSMHICPRCETTLSQSEVSDGYKDVKDLSAIAKFELNDELNTFVLAWTTTPWTLIGNVALAVGKDIDYGKVSIIAEGKEVCKYILSVDYIKNKLSTVLDKDNQTFEWDNKIIKGSELVGKSYKPLFDYYYNDKTANFENGWKVYDAEFVNTEDGTGVVHIAPAFGEDDMNLGKKHNLPFIQHVGINGEIKAEAKDFSGLHVKPTDDLQKTDVEIIKYLASRGLLFYKEKFEHSYPHCWRCDTPLINYATSSWFVSVTKVKDQFLELAKEINWSPKYIKNGRFGKWLEGSRDWSISRQRYWASVMPIWRCDCGEMQVFGSVEELEKASGQKIVDIHKFEMDKITVPCKCGKTAKRVPDVLDTWFDSGSMPYAQLHYPFENKEKFESTFPADFIAEGVDQTRCWFYYLHVISAAITGKIAYKNVIVNGTVLADDGKKMSKKLQNYPDPAEMFDKYGADVLRIYLLSSPVVAAENFSFSEKEMAEYQRGIFRMIWNSYYFFILYSNIDKWEPNNQNVASENLLDRWILSELNKLIADVNSNMENYNLDKATKLFTPFVDNLSNWYIRRSRKRFWKSENDGDKNNAYQTLYTVFVELSKVLAPFTPFIADEIFKNLTSKESVHLEDYPTTNNEYIDEDLNNQMGLARKIVEMGLALRSKNGVKVRQPLSILKYSGEKLVSELEEIIADEVNVKSVQFLEKSDNPDVDIDFTITEKLKLEGLARDMIRNIQSLRKTADFNIEDRINVLWQTESELLRSVMQNTNDLIAKEVLAVSIKNNNCDKYESSENYKLDGETIWIGILRN